MSPHRRDPVTPGSALLRAIDDPDQLQEGIEDNLHSLQVSQLGAVNLRLPGDGRVGARFDDQPTAMVAARDEDLIAGISLSYVSLEQLRHAVAGTDIVCVQNLFHLADRRAAPLFEECLSRCIAFVPFCPLRWPRCQEIPELTSPVVIQTAALLGITPAQAALRWLLQLALRCCSSPGPAPSLTRGRTWPPKYEARRPGAPPIGRRRTLGCLSSH